MGDDLYGVGTLPFRTKDIRVYVTWHGQLKNLGASRTVSFTSNGLDLDTQTATFDKGRKLIARLRMVSEKLTIEQAAGILFAVRHTPTLRKASILRRWLSPDDLKTAMLFELREVFDAKTVFETPPSECYGILWAGGCYTRFKKRC